MSLNIHLYTKPDCDYCSKAKQYLDERNIKYTIEVITSPEAAIRVKEKLGWAPDERVTLPIVMIDGRYRGGYEGLKRAIDDMIAPHTEMKRLLSSAVVEMNIRKKDGSQRPIRCTLSPDLCPPVTEKTDARKVYFDPTYLRVFDLDKQAYRTIMPTQVLNIVDYQHHIPQL